MLNAKSNKQTFLRGGKQLSLLLGVALIGMAPAANAVCTVENDEKIELNISPETQSWGDYKGRQLITASKVYKCQEDAGRYLMISLGSVQWDNSTDVSKAYIFDSYEPKSCELTNSKTMAAFDASRTKDNFGRQYKFLRSCIDLRVIELGRAPIIAQEHQEFCDIERKSDDSVILRGDMCFLKIRPFSQFAIQPVLNPKCATPEFLDSLGVEAQDIYANLDILTAGDDTGMSTDVEHIGSRSMHINITPKANLLKLSEDFGEGVPRFITTYNLDADWGSLAIQGGDHTEFNLSFYVSNLTDKKCSGINCSGNSNFTQPFVGQVELFQVSKSGKSKLIEEWWDGGLVPPNWQGFVRGIGYRVADDLIIPGQKYRMVATFQDPTDDYAIFLNGLKQMLIRQFDSEGATVGIDTIPAISTLSNLGLIPSLYGTSNLGSSNQTVDLSQAINGLEGIIASTVWPPYYEKVCAEGENCMKLGKNKFHQRLILEFVAGASPNGDGKIVLKDLQMQKVSPVFKSYPMQRSDFLSLNCGR